MTVPPKVVASRRSNRPMGRRAPASLAILAAFGLVACPEPTNGEPQIPVAPGVGERLGYMRGHGVPSASAPKPPQVARAHAHPMKAGEQLGGPHATGRVGDWVLENEEVLFVVDALGGGGGFAESGGNLVDAADARLRKDELGQVVTYFGSFPRQAVYTSLEGTDLDAGFGTEQGPLDIDTSADLRKLPAILEKRGYSAPDFAGSMGGNWLRFCARNLPAK